MPIVQLLSFVLFCSTLSVGQAEPLNRTLKSPLQHVGKALIPAMVTIPSGCFMMGSAETEQDHQANEALHRVCLNRFNIGKYEVTVEEFQHFVDDTAFISDAEHATEENGCWSYDHSAAKHWDWWDWSNWRLPVKNLDKNPNFPVGCLSFHDVQAYITWLNQQSGQHYRLPTEAEWEYAARAGTRTARYWGDNPDIACRYANVADTKKIGALFWAQWHNCEDGRFFYSVVGNLLPNAYGIYDMLGNVWEWTCSRYDDPYSGSETTCQNAKPDFDDLIVLRGGGWNADAARVRAAYRNWNTAWARQANLGFRLVLDK